MNYYSKFLAVFYYSIYFGVDAFLRYQDDYVGCTANPVLPDQPFIVVWNVPTYKCKHLNLTRYGILTNQDDKYSGDVMTIFYTIYLGLFPYIADNGTIVNGGIPQLGNLSLHLDKLTRDIEKRMPNKHNAGVSVLDFESWRPTFEANWDSLKKYQDMSIKLVKEHHPDWTNKTKIYDEARREFDAGAKLFFLSTLELVRKLRGEAHWGYYGFPRCIKDCAKVNDKLPWLWEGVTGLYPRIYQTINQPKPSRITEVETIVHEALRVKAKFMPANMLILPYTKVQTGGTYFFNEDDLNLAIRLPGDIGSSGVVIWGGSASSHTPGECELKQAYLDNVLGPFVLNLTTFYTNCSQTKCTGHGRCIDKKYEMIYQKYLRKYGRIDCRINSENFKNWSKPSKYSNKIFPLNSDNYVCKCYAGWKGSHCDVQTLQ